MNPMPDIQAQNDSRRITIDKVGVKGVRYPILVDDRANGVQATIAEVNLYVDLHHSKRGTHMSRFIEILNRYHQDNIIAQLDKLLIELKTVLDADAAYIDLAFPYFIQKQAPVSKISALMDYQCFFNASYADDFELWIGARIPVTLLCPCSKEISTEGAHNQRSLVTLKVRYEDFIWLEELIEVVEEVASCPVYPLLKRHDEKFVTETAYARPRFVEDIAREATQRLESDPRIQEFSVEVESFESIHNHNAYALVCRPRLA